MTTIDYTMNLRKTYNAYKKMCEPVFRKYEISPVSYDILMFLANNPEYKTAQDICDFKCIKKNLVSVHVDKLVNAGLLERGYIAGDRRKISLSPTPRASAIIDEGLALQKEFYERIISGISEEDWAAYKRINDQVIKNTNEILNN